MESSSISDRAWRRIREAECKNNSAIRKGYENGGQWDWTVGQTLLVDSGTDTLTIPLIAIEIFINITLYLKTDVIPVRLVVATALMAISRKVIIFDFEKITPQYVLGTAAVVLALGITYWFITKKP